MGWWVADYVQSGQVPLLLSWIFWVIFSITMHELSHGWAALWQGDTTPRDLDRMTLNPIVHMGPWSLLMFALIGIAWGVMPVNPHRFRDRRWGDLYVAAAGPLMNVALALVAAVALGFWVRYAPPGGTTQTNWVDHVEGFFKIGAILNIVLAVFNMFPIPPLDGSTVLKALSPGYARMIQNPQAQMFGLFIVLALLFVGGFEILFTVAAIVTELTAGALAAVLP